MFFYRFVRRMAIGGGISFLLIALSLSAAASPAENGTYSSEGTNESPLVIVADSQPQAVVTVYTYADAVTRHAAETLVEYVYKSTGATLPLLDVDGPPEPPGGTEVRIHIGSKPGWEDPNVASELAGMDTDGFLIRPDGQSITIVGPTPTGTQNGVFTFLEAYVGVRWLIPGPDGEDVPAHTDVEIPRLQVREEPAFTYRAVSPFTKDPLQTGPQQMQSEWARRNKLQGDNNVHISFMHRLYALVPQDVYGDTHPEYYPKGVPPAPGVRSGWQPCFSEPGTVQAAATRIIDYFNTHPTADTYSLGVNDSGGFCEADPTHPAYPGTFNSAGFVDLSDVYYQWVNEVAAQVLQVHPDKYFGLLAYREVIDPPSFPLNTHVIPFITKDRMAWADEDQKAGDQAIMEQWEQVASQFGWYDYMYGTLYAAPRVYTRLMADNYRYSAQHHVVAHYTEMYNNWGDGPKAYLSAKMQWDPTQDVEALLDEWMERMVGSAAAADLQAYFDLWEQIWTERVPSTSWFRSSKHQVYLNFNDASYLDAVTETDLEAGEALLDAVVVKAVTDKQKARATMLRQSFDYYSASARSYPRSGEPPANEGEALDTLSRLADDLDDRLDMAQERHERIEQYAQNPLLAFQLKPNVDWSGWNPYEFWQLVDYMKASEPAGGTVTDEVYAMARQAASPNVREYARLLEEVGQGLFNLMENSSFESGTQSAPPWTNWVASTGTLRRTETVSRTGNASMMADHLARGGPVQSIAVQPGLTAVRVHYYTPSGTQTGGSIQLRMSFLDGDRKFIKAIYSGAKPFADTAGQWSSVEMLEPVPAQINGKDVNYIQITPIIDNAQNIDVYLDDAMVFQHAPELVTPQSFWTLVDYIGQNEPSGGPIRGQVEESVQGAEQQEQRDLARLLLDIVDGADPVNANVSFETGTTVAPPWTYWIEHSGTIQRATGTARTGTAALQITSFQRGGPLQTVPAGPGPFAARAYFLLPAGSSSNGKVQLYVDLMDAQMKVLARPKSDIIPIGPAGQWGSVEFAGTIPASVDGKAVANIRLVVTVSFVENGVTVYVDDASLYWNAP